MLWQKVTTNRKSESTPVILDNGKFIWNIRGKLKIKSSGIILDGDNFIDTTQSNEDLDKAAWWNDFPVAKVQGFVEFNWIDYLS